MIDSLSSELDAGGQVIRRSARPCKIKGRHHESILCSITGRSLGVRVVGKIIDDRAVYDIYVDDGRINMNSNQRAIATIRQNDDTGEPEIELKAGK